ncbi:hypothetical protein, partial [Streptococcus pneumoniae]|uniref:hypothetical protein n=1 Tax=Streptococcus pneumoniae TaxID=1313 RepID=UPI001E62A085
TTLFDAEAIARALYWRSLSADRDGKINDMAAERARLLIALDDIPFRTVGEGAILARVADLIRAD